MQQLNKDFNPLSLRVFCLFVFLLLSCSCSSCFFSRSRIVRIYLLDLKHSERRLLDLFLDLMFVVCKSSMMIIEREGKKLLRLTEIISRNKSGTQFIINYKKLKTLKKVASGDCLLGKFIHLFRTSRKHLL